MIQGLKCTKLNLKSFWLQNGELFAVIYLLNRWEVIFGRYFDPAIPIPIVNARFQRSSRIVKIKLSREPGIRSQQLSFLLERGSYFFNFNIFIFNALYLLNARVYCLVQVWSHFEEDTNLIWEALPDLFFVF